MTKRPNYIEKFESCGQCRFYYKFDTAIKMKLDSHKKIGFGFCACNDSDHYGHCMWKGHPACNKVDITR